jgi:hypothetical protein
MGVEALHPDTRAADATEGSRSGVIGWNSGITLACVSVVRGSECGRVDVLLCLPNAAH